MYKNQRAGFPNSPTSPVSPKVSSPAPEYYEPTAQDLQLKKLIDELFQKYDKNRKLVLGIEELPAFLN
jgi:hypothetical protein